VGPLLLLWAFFTALYFYATSVLTSSVTLSSIALAGYTRGLLVMDIASWLRKVVRTTGPPTAVLSFAASCLQASQDLDYVHRLLMFGGVPASLVLAPALLAGTGNSPLLGAPANGVVSATLFADTCTSLWTSDVAAFPQSPTVLVTSLGLSPSGVAPAGYAGTAAVPGASLDDCRQLLTGTLASSGLHGGVLALRSATASFVQRRLSAVVPLGSASGVGNLTTLAGAQSAALMDALTATAGDTSAALPAVPAYTTTATAYSLPGELATASMDGIRGAGFTFLPRASFLIAAQYAGAGQAIVNAFLTFQAAFSAVFLVVYAAFLAAIYVPSIRGENRDIHRQRAMLLLLPPAVVSRSADLRALLLAVTSSSAATVSTAAGSGGAGGGGADAESGSSQQQAQTGGRRIAGGLGPASDSEG